MSSVSSMVGARGQAALLLLASAGCSPAVDDGGQDPESGPLGWEGRYGVYFSDEAKVVFVGDVLLDEGGVGEFLPGWACDENVRFLVDWNLEQASGTSASNFEFVVKDLPTGKSVRVFGEQTGCFDGPLEGEYDGLKSNVLLLPNDGYCLDEVSDGEGAWSDEGCLVEDCGTVTLPPACRG